ncbi:MAG: methyltransferase [Candidatus Thorarchaeota archaeon]|jgi:protein-S-isoprenylcysteine O-methyltransferase Ste14
MADELTFRVLFIVLYALFFIPRGYYRFVKPRQEKETSEAVRLGFGKTQAALSIIILGYLVTSILYLLSQPWMDWSQIPQYPIWLRLGGTIIVLVMIPLLTWIHRELDRQYSAVPEIKTDHQLITTGPYEKVRHPMYTVFCLLSLGMSLVTANMLVILFAVLLTVAFPWWVRVEEQMMIETFGDEYIEYMDRTGRFFPKLSASERKLSEKEMA